MELAWAGCDDDEIAAYSGHANKDMIRKYAGQARQDLRASAQGKAPANRTCTERKPDNRTDNCLRPVLSKPNETTGSASWRSGYAADCKSVYTGSIPVLASNKINDLRHSSSPSLPLLKQALKLSCFGLSSFHTVSCLLGTGCQFSLANWSAVFFQHLNSGMPCNRFHHLVITSSQIELDCRVLSQSMRFVVTGLFVLHLLFDRAHLFGDDAIAD